MDHGLAEQLIAAAAADEHVVAGSGRERIVAGGTEQHIVARGAVNGIQRMFVRRPQFGIEQDRGLQIAGVVFEIPVPAQAFMTGPIFRCGNIGTGQFSQVGDKIDS